MIERLNPLQGNLHPKSKHCMLATKSDDTDLIDLIDQGQYQLPNFKKKDLQRDMHKKVPETERMGWEGFSAVAMMKDQWTQKEDKARVFLKKKCIWLINTV